tara:strand:- start:211 stop:687 length:477 start_codon:yes stop_codon:yes gene_type:complete
MQTDALAQLRDIHLPPGPGWWPPAPGWWLLALAALGGIAYLAYVLFRRYHKGRPMRAARASLQSLYEDHQSGRLGAPEYVHQSNELLKRVVVHSLGRSEAGPASGQDWLQILDGYAGGVDFTRGPGQVLGQARFLPNPQVDAEALQVLMDTLLRKVTP